MQVIKITDENLVNVVVGSHIVNFPNNDDEAEQLFSTNDIERTDFHEVEKILFDEERITKIIYPKIVDGIPTFDDNIDVPSLFMKASLQMRINKQLLVNGKWWLIEMK